MNNLTTIPAPGSAVGQWDPNSGEALPAHIANALGDLGTNIPDRQTVPSLSYEGKVWQIVKEGNRTKLQAQNSDGDMVPIPIMRMIILNFNNERGRAYYPGTYNPAQSAAPVCWSPDGKAPDPSSKEKQAELCASCPQSVKGSKLLDGKEMVACGSHRMIAVAPAFDILGDPLRLKIAVTSDYDKEVVEHGWFAFRQYTDYLKSRGIAHSALVVTKAKFDNNTAYPKLLFAIDRILSAEEVEQVRQALENKKIAELLAERWTPAGVNGTPTDDSDIKPQDESVPAARQTIEGTVTTINPLAAALADGWTPHPDAPGYHYKGQEVVADTDLAARYPIVAAAPTVPETTSVPAAPAAPAASPSEPVIETIHDPMVAATADGWTPHPDAPGYHYKGQEVVADGDLAARYPSATPATTAATAADPAGASTSTTAPTAASPSEGGAIPADVQDLLNKWGTASN